jgi:23S rRNA (adenine2503-C2)-methyltransferase
MGLVRNLTAEEILSQVYWAKQSVQRHSMHALTNIVFMGMGDIGINLDAVSSAIAVLVDKDRFGFSSRKVRYVCGLQLLLYMKLICCIQ